jgi:hypothetical protein
MTNKIALVTDASSGNPLQGNPRMLFEPFSTIAP